MTAADLDRIEATLGLVLPPAYRVLMLAYPAFLREAPYRSPVGGRASDILLFADAERVIRYNQDWREDGFLVGEDGGPRRPDRHMIIGEDGGGNCWCVRLGSDGEEVSQFDHEDGSLEPSAASLAEHLGQLRRLLVEIASGEASRAACRGTPP